MIRARALSALVSSSTLTPVQAVPNFPNETIHTYHHSCLASVFHFAFLSLIGLLVFMVLTSTFFICLLYLPRLHELLVLISLF